jgi:hypothetical protein
MQSIQAITTIDGDTATIQPVHGSERGQLAKQLIDAAGHGNARAVRTRSIKGGGRAFVVPVAIAEAAGLIPAEADTGQKDATPESTPQQSGETKTAEQTHQEAGETKATEAEPAKKATAKKTPAKKAAPAKALSTDVGEAGPSTGEPGTADTGAAEGGPADSHVE